jgi:DNA-binding transcriptional LysR family regulator
MQRDNWDDLRFVLAVAREGSLSGAARRLGVNHATVLRRIDAFEHARGVVVFDRTARGYAVAPQRARLIESLEAMEDAALAVGRSLEALRSPLIGVVRVTSTDTFCQAVLPPLMAQIRDHAEGLSIELNASNQHVSLAHLDADIAVRPTHELPPELVGRRAGRLGFAVYAAPQGRDMWLAPSGPLARSTPAKWLEAHVSAREIAARADSFLVLREMAATGQGRAVLPCVLGDADVRLMRLPGAMPEMLVDIWVASHADLAEVARIKAVRELLTEALIRDGARLEGKV